MTRKVNFGTVSANQILAIQDFDKYIGSCPQRKIKSDIINITRTIPPTKKDDRPKRQLISFQVSALLGSQNGKREAIDVCLHWLNASKRKTNDGMSVFGYFYIADSEGIECLKSEFHYYYLSRDKPKAICKNIFTKKEIYKCQRDVVSNGGVKLQCAFNILGKESSDASKEICAETRYDWETLGSCFKGLLDSGEFCDVTIICQGVRFSCHKMVLISRSDVFRAMFSHEGMRECRTNTVEIEDAEPDSVHEMINFMYLDRCKNMSKHVWKLLPLADKYNLTRLMQECEFWLTHNLCAENAVDTLLLADRHSLRDLTDNALDYTALNIGSIMTTDSWKKISEERLDLIAKLVKIKLPPGSLEMRKKLTKLKLLLNPPKRTGPGRFRSKITRRF